MRACSDKTTRENGLELKEGSFRLVIRKEFLTVGLLRPWNGFPREVVAFSSLEKCPRPGLMEL